MQTQSAQDRLSITETQATTNQNENSTNKSVEDKKVKYFKKVVHGLGVRNQYKHFVIILFGVKIFFAVYNDSSLLLLYLL